MWNLEKSYRRTSLQSRNRDTDVENKLMNTRGGKEAGGMNLEIGIHIHTLLCIKYIGCILLTCFNLYAEYVMRNTGLDEAQAGIKIAGRSINKLRYADDTTFMAESEELKNLLMKKRRVKKLA